MISVTTARLSYVILTIALMVILISSPVIVVFSPSLLLPIALKVEFAFATSSENNEDDNNEGEGGGGEESSTTDAVTDDEEEEGVDDNGGADVQQEDNTEQEQQPPSSFTQQEEDDEDGGGEEGGQQFATVVGEICDDFEDNDADGLIDLADVEDCAPPATQGTVTAPTTPPPSVINTTATNSTANTLSATGITPPQQDSPYIVEVCDNRIDDDGDGLADEDDFEGCAPPSTSSSNPRYMTPTGDIVDVTGCTSFEELGVEPPPPSPGDPPNLVYFDCDNITWALIPLDSTTTSTDSGTGTAGGEEGGQQGLAQGQGQQQQQQPNSASECPPQPTNYYDAQARIINVQLTPSSQTTTTACSPGDSSSSAGSPPSPQAPPTSTTTSQEPILEICSDGGDDDGDGLADWEDPDCAAPAPLTGGAVTSNNNLPTSIDQFGNVWTHYPDGTKERTDMEDGASMTIYPDGTERRRNPDGTSLTIYHPDGIVVGEHPDGRIRVTGLGNSILAFSPDGTAIIEDFGCNCERPMAPRNAELVYSLLLMLLVTRP